MAVGLAGTGVLALALSAPAQAQSGHFNCRSTGLALGGNPVPPTVTNPQYSPCNPDQKEETESQETAFPVNLLLPPDAEPTDQRLGVQTFYTRTQMRKGYWAQSYANVGYVRLGTTEDDPAEEGEQGLIIELVESSATVLCRRGRPTLTTWGGVADVHIFEDGRETIVNVGNGYDFIRIPGMGVLELNKTERPAANKIQRTAVVLTNERDPAQPMKVVEISKTEAGYTGNPCRR